MNMEIYDENDIKEKYKKQLRLVKENASDIWEQLLKVGLCPYLFGLPCDCGMNKDCRHCWDQAMSMEYNDEVKTTPTGRFYCAADNKFLKRIKPEDGSDFYECPTCHKQFEMQHGDNGCITKIISRGRKTPDTPEPTPTTDPNNPDYNEE